MTMMPTASNFLPDNLRQTPVPKMMELLGQQKDSKSSHRHVIERLAHVEQITDRKEKEKTIAVMNEIEGRAQNKDKEAMAILHEVETVKETDGRNANSSPAVTVQVGEIKPETSAGININVNEARPEADRKVRDSSMDSKGEEKNNKKKPDDKKKGDGKKDKEEKTGEQGQKKENQEPNTTSEELKTKN